MRNSTDQWADADVDNDQSNVNAPTSVGHGGDDKSNAKAGDDGNGGGGSVSQSNDATNSAAAGNSNDTIQDVTQAQAAGGDGSLGSVDVRRRQGRARHDGDHKGAGQDQTATVDNDTEQ